MNEVILAKANSWLNGNFDEDTKATVKEMMAENEQELMIGIF